MIYIQIYPSNLMQYCTFGTWVLLQPHNVISSNAHTKTFIWILRMITSRILLIKIPFTMWITLYCIHPRRYALQGPFDRTSWSTTFTIEQLLKTLSYWSLNRILFASSRIQVKLNQNPLLPSFALLVVNFQTKYSAMTFSPSIKIPKAEHRVSSKIVLKWSQPL